MHPGRLRARDRDHHPTPRRPRPAPRRGAGAARGHQPEADGGGARRGPGAVRGRPGRRHHPPAAAPRGADRRRGRAPRPRPRPVPRRRRGRAIPGVGDAAVRAGVAVVRDDGPPPAGDVAAAVGHRRRTVVVAPVRALVQRLGPHVEDGRAGRGAARRPGRPRRAGRSPRRRRLPARVPGRGARRAGGARLDRRRVPVDRRPSGAHRPLGRRGRPPVGVLGRRPALDPRRRRGVHLPDPRAAADRRGARARRRAGRAAAVGPRAVGAAGRRASCSTAWSRGCRGSRTSEHLLPDLLPDTALVLLVEPKRMRDRAQELLDEEAVARGDARGHVGRGGRARPAAALARLRPPARAHRRRRGVGAVDTRRPRHAARSPATAFDPSSATPTRSPRRLRALAGEGFRVVLAAEGTGSAQRLHDVLAGEGLDVDRGRSPRRARCGWSSRRSNAASCCPARSSRSSPRPTSPVAAACTAARAARAAVRTTTTTLEPGDYVVHYQHGVGRYLEMKPLTHGRRRARLPAGSSSRTARSTCPPTRWDSSASTPAARRPRSTAWAAPTSRSNGRGSAARCARSPRSSWCCTASGWRRPGTRLRSRHAVAARDRGGVPVRGDARPAPGDQRRQGRHGAADPDGPARLRRRRLRQDRGRGARRVQGGAGRHAGRRAGAHHVARRASTARRSASASPTTRCGSRCCRGSSARRSRRRSCATSSRARSTSLIGTHRLLSADVKPKHLGLLVVDEEQRFGVQHKELHQAAVAPTSTCSRSPPRRSRGRSSCRSPASATSRW